MDDAGCWDTARHRYHATCDGRILCYQSTHAPSTEPILRFCLLDWLLDKHNHRGALAALDRTSISGGKHGRVFRDLAGALMRTGEDHESKIYHHSSRDSIRSTFCNCWLPSVRADVTGAAAQAGFSDGKREQAGFGDL